MTANAQSAGEGWAGGESLPVDFRPGGSLAPNLRTEAGFLASAGGGHLPLLTARSERGWWNGRADAAPVYVAQMGLGAMSLFAADAMRDYDGVVAFGF